MNAAQAVLFQNEWVSSTRQIKSRERVREIGEVFTREEEVNAMLDLLGDVSHSLDARFLEPAAGNGNFLTAILARKLEIVKLRSNKVGKTRERKQKDFEYEILIATASIYAVDISESNVMEARNRLYSQIISFYSNVLNTMIPTDGFKRAVKHVLTTNIVLGDMLKGTHKISFIEYSSPKTYMFSTREYRLADLLMGGLYAKPKSTPSRMVPYWELGDD